MKLLLVILGFSLIIVIHELGHFLAARWAGIRVLAFAVGFGPAGISWRKGLGFRVGSSEAEYEALVDEGRAGPDISPTEYRFNLLPFGGYVKMLGQEDLDPTAASDAPDSYQSASTGKRMVVISAGVVLNVITGALLYMAVFMSGLETEPPWVGNVMAGSPAARARALNAAELGVTEPGLQGGDRILEVNGREPRSFNDLVLASAIASKGDAIELVVGREGVSRPLRFSIVPERRVEGGLFGIGIQQSRSVELFGASTPDQQAALREAFDRVGWQGVEPGMSLQRVAGNDAVRDPYAILRAMRRSDGEKIKVEFAGAGKTAEVEIEPSPEYQRDLGRWDADGKYVYLDHLLGLAPVMTVGQTEDRGRDQGLRDGDIFVRLGEADYPGIPQGRAQIQAHAGRSIDITVLRRSQDDTEPPTFEQFAAEVSDDGRIGFVLGSTATDSALLAAPPQDLKPLFGDGDPRPTAANVLGLRAGARIVEVDGRAVTSFTDLRGVLQTATRTAFDSGAATADVAMTVFDAGGDLTTEAEPRRVTWSLSREDLERLHALGWTTGELAFFRPESITLRADQPLQAVGMGLGETHRVILMTYVTIVRAFQGSVKIEHLKGPIGIVALGTQVAERGFVWLLFLMAMISINLAVINFLPLPVVDGGQFLFLLFEAVRGRPVSIGFQKAVTMVGLVLIASLFLLVTYNDIVGLITGS